MLKENKKPIYVTSPSLAPLKEFNNLLKKVWDSGIITHNGPLVQLLEKELKAYLNLPNIVVVTNGTIAIQLAIKALNLKGEIITTPFTYIATANAIRWEQCTPVFIDIDPKTFNINPNLIEEAITNRTCAILGVHVFSNPCDIRTIDILAKKYNLKVIYDGAHAMCVKFQDKSLFEYGDISVASFHATKLFNSGEGGACITNDNFLNEKLRRLRFFGHNDEKQIVDDGCNAKMTEIHAALGLVNIKYINSVLKKRKSIYYRYFEHLHEIEYVSFQKFDDNCYNYSYMPILLDSKERVLELQKILNKEEIYPRRYFYPSLNTVNAISSYKPLPVSEDIANRILCLPSYNNLSLEIVDYICDLISNQK